MAAAMAIKDPEVKPCEVGVEQSPDETSLCGDVSQDLPSLFDEFSPSAENLTREQLVELQKQHPSFASLYTLVDHPSHNCLVLVSCCVNGLMLLLIV